MRIVAKGALLGLQFGTALLSFADLLAQPSLQLLIQDALGNPTSVGSPMVPCEVTVGASAASLQQHGYLVPRPPAPRSFPRHLFFMTRGTRGDVQPFVALAKGLANAHGWLVTICTELYWREFVLSEVAELRAGAVHFLPSGGDTHAVTGQWVHQQVMKMQLDAIQQFINGAAEWGFFNSVPVFVHQLKRLQASAQPVDLLVCSFTTPGVGLLCSEVCSVPMVNYCTQPGVIPTSDPAADPRLFKSQALMLLIKKGLESFVAPLFSASGGTPISLFKMRRQLGLPVSVDAWPTLVAQRVPIIIPMHPSTFTLPADWGAHVVCTDFIFLRGLQGDLQGEIAAFVAHARQAGRKLCLITFSSMPVGRGAMLRVALKMIEESRHPLSVLYVGRLQPELLSTALESQLARCTLQGSFLEVAKGDFGVLFPQMDALIVHGGLGTTVEALRARKPVAVTGILMMDQLFWGQVCAAKGVGPPPSTIDEFQKGCVEFIDAALDPTSSYAQAAATLSYGDVDDDGVATNVRLLAQLLQGANLKPIVTATLARPGAGARPSLCSDVLRVLNIVLPTAFANSLEYLPVLIGMAFVGHYCTKTELDAVALGRTYFNVVASAPGFGIITALRTLMPQAVGAGQQQLCALYLQRAFLFIALWGGVAVALAFQTTRVLTLLGQPAEASRLAQPYVLALMPQYVGVVGMSAIQRYYQALGLNYANLAICLLTFSTAPALQWLFIVHFDMGYLGAAHAAAVYNTVYLVLQVPHLVCRGDGDLFVPRARTLQGRGLREYVWLMVPGLVMTLLEWWVLEALVLLSGRLHQSATAIAAFTLTAQVQSMGLMAWIGLAVAASMLIGQCIGAGDL
jgi:UDP:flavonoid glycosyltransferase YjiC (YdhE family)